MSWPVSSGENIDRTAMCLEITTSSETLHFATSYLCEDDNFWSGKILSISNIRRSIDPENKRFEIADIQVTLNNIDPDFPRSGYFAALLENKVLDNCVASVYVAIKKNGSWLKKRLYTGRLSIDSLTVSEFVILVKPSFREKIGLLQRSISELSFPQVNESSSGMGMNIVLGAMTGSSSGAVACTCVDEATGEFLVAQHPVSAINRVYRIRSGTSLRLSSEVFTSYISRVDNEGNKYASVIIDSSEREAEDKFYADVRGLLNGQLSCIIFDGSSTRITGLNDDTPFLPGRNTETPSFTIETKISMSGSAATQQIFGIGSPGMNLAWALTRTTSNALQFSLSMDGTNQDYYAISPNLTVDTDYFVRITVDFNSHLLKMWINGALQTFASEYGSVPASLYTSNQDFTIGCKPDSSAFFKGKLYYLIISEGIYNLAVGENSYIDSALDNRVIEIEFNYDLSDLTRKNSLTLTGSEVYESSNENRIPAMAIRQMLLYFSSITPDDIDEYSFVEATALCYQRGYSANSYFGLTIPKEEHELETNEDPWSVLQSCCEDFNHTLVITSSGKIAIKSLDTSSCTDATIINYDQENGDIDQTGLQIDYNTIERKNLARVTYSLSQSSASGSDKYLVGYNEISAERFGLNEDARTNRVARDSSMAKDVLKRQLLMESGQVPLFRWTVPGLHALQDNSDLGDIVSVACDLTDNEDKQVMITAVNFSPASFTTTFEGMAMGAEFFVGSIGISEEVTITLEPSEDTYVNSGSVNSSYGSADSFKHGEYDPTIHRRYRCAMKYDLSQVSQEGGTIVSASLQIHVAQAYDKRFIHLRQLLETTWGESSTYSRFTNNGGGTSWSENYIGSTDLAPVLSGSRGFKTFVLNDAGINYLNSVLGSNNEAHFTMNNMEWQFELVQTNYVFSSSEDISENRPRLTLVYQT